ncbi:MAG: methyltransferase domain-containing protein [Chloroflexi bacterium]|nr:methyltransferase domain-containing protein [Chloroflexota bacterium]
MPTRREARTPYDLWAGFYDAFHSFLTEDIAFYVEEAKCSGGPVLELGCGTGRVSVPIAQAGVPVVGVDTSRALLRAARRKARAATLSPAQASFREGDMRTLRLRGQFTLAILPYHTFQVLLTVEEQKATLANIYQHLRPGGCLAFDLAVVTPEELAAPPSTPFHWRDIHDPQSGRRFVVWAENCFDRDSQVDYARLTIDEVDGEQRSLQRYYRDYTMRYLGRYEAQHLLELCGFEVEALYGDFSRGAFTEDSDEMVWVARRG